MSRHIYHRHGEVTTLSMVTTYNPASSLNVFEEETVLHEDILGVNFAPPNCETSESIDFWEIFTHHDGPGMSNFNCFSPPNMNPETNPTLVYDDGG